MEHKQYSFEAYFKKVLINKARNLHKKRIHHQTREILFSDLPNEIVLAYAYEDQYDFSMPSTCEWQGQRFTFENRALGEALRYLLPKYREIILLSYFNDCSDIQIAKCLNIPLSTVGDRRRRAIQQLKERLNNTDV